MSLAPSELVPYHSCLVQVLFEPFGLVSVINYRINHSVVSEMVHVILVSGRLIALPNLFPLELAHSFLLTQHPLLYLFGLCLLEQFLLGSRQIQQSECVLHQVELYLLV